MKVSQPAYAHLPASLAANWRSDIAFTPESVTAYPDKHPCSGGGRCCFRILDFSETFLDREEIEFLDHSYLVHLPEAPGFLDL